MRKRHHYGRWLAASLAILLVSYISYALVKPLPAPSINTQATATIPAKQAELAWPVFGQAAVGATGYGLLESKGTQTPYPIASVAKVIAAMAILDKKPLKAGEQGPALTITAEDVAIYNRYVAIDGSVSPVRVGTQLSQYQLLQAMMLPSANNLTDSAVNWVFGSQEAYIRYAETYVKKLRLSNTRVADASGFSPHTVSTADDLVQLGLVTLNHPVMSEIVAQPTATIPVAGTIRNVNILLGNFGINGIKTGNTEEAGGCFVSASKKMVGNKEVKVVTAIVGAPDLPAALRSTVPLVRSAQNNFEAISAIQPGQQVGSAKTEWGASSPVIAKTSSGLTRWQAAPVLRKVELSKQERELEKGSAIGNITVSAGNTKQTVTAVLAQPLPDTSIWWRLSNAF